MYERLRASHVAVDSKRRRAPVVRHDVAARLSGLFWRSSVCWTLFSCVPRRFHAQPTCMHAGSFRRGRNQGGEKKETQHALRFTLDPPRMRQPSSDEASRQHSLSSLEPKSSSASFPANTSPIYIHTGLKSGLGVIMLWPFATSRVDRACATGNESAVPWPLPLWCYAAKSSSP